MSTERRRVDRDEFYESKKSVYVMSDLYENISSEEEDLNHDDRIIEKETDFDHLDDISLDDFLDVDEDFISNTVGDTDGEFSSIIYSDMPKEGEKHRVFDLLDDVPLIARLTVQMKKTVM